MAVAFRKTSGHMWYRPSFLPAWTGIVVISGFGNVLAMRPEPRAGPQYFPEIRGAEMEKEVKGAVKSFDDNILVVHGWDGEKVATSQKRMNGGEENARNKAMWELRKQAKDLYSQADYDTSIRQLKERMHKQSIDDPDEMANVGSDKFGHYFTNSGAQEVDLLVGVANIKKSADYMRALAKSVADKMDNGYDKELIALHAQIDKIEPHQIGQLTALIKEQEKDENEKRLKPLEKIDAINPNHGLDKDLKYYKDLLASKEGYQKTDREAAAEDTASDNHDVVS